MSAGRARAEMERVRANFLDLQSKQFSNEKSTHRSSEFRLDVATLERELALRISQLLQSEFSSIVLSRLSKNTDFSPRVVPFPSLPAPQLICKALGDDDAAAIAASHIASNRILNSANVSKFSPRSNLSAPPPAPSARQLRPIALDDAAEKVMNVALKRLPRRCLNLDDASQPSAAPVMSAARPILSSPPRIVVSAPSSMPDVIVHELDSAVASCAAAFRRRCAGAAAPRQKGRVQSLVPQHEQLRAREQATVSSRQVEKVHRPRICIVVLDEAARVASESFAARLHV